MHRAPPLLLAVQLHVILAITSLGQYLVGSHAPMVNILVPSQGCSPSCSASYSQPGYLVSGCGNGGTTAGGTCSATCDSGHGYTGNVEGDVHCDSTTANYDGSFTGCALATCPAYSQTGYIVLGCSSGSPYGSDCLATCDSANGYSGQASGSVSCGINGYVGSFTGCSPTCSASFTETGYVVIGCGPGTPSGSQISASCDTSNGFAGSVSGGVTCTNGKYSGSFSGCSPTCPAYTEAGYAVSGCGALTPSGSTCSAACDSSNGFAGSVTGTVHAAMGNIRDLSLVVLVNVLPPMYSLAM